MNKTLLLILIAFINYPSHFPNKKDYKEEYIERQGEVSFFSYTPVENIQATNNQALSIFDTKTNEVAVRILMRAFVFKKSLMHEHFNESYIESDLYPEATFSGKIIDFDPSIETMQTRIIKGDFTLKDVTKSVDIKATISIVDGNYIIKGGLDILIDDYNIKVPALLSPNISKKIEVTFNFKYSQHEK
ncbi:YceI family protein [uncultured Psychroserpens sp.]|uniref:YceI family protein n=1 Tax=uncultured Psychroserpens sp. TaxID=255436 RepID=UPI00260A667A|nr:YceI family protein [uncultured Psychroserpens sp.]